MYKAHDERLGRDVAIKVLKTDLASDPERLRRFEQEARAASALNHPNIIHIYDIGQHEATHYIAMEFVEGKTLRELLSEGPLPTETLLRFATQIAEGLAKAHAAGIIHRDLKPENLMVSNDGYVKILDFGLAKLLPQPGADSEAATVTKEGTVAGAVMGTVSYMSPEQALGQPLDPKTDVFSLGAVLYEMATGKRPFQGETTAGLFNEILNKSPLSPSSVNPKLPGDLDRIIGSALEKDAGKRYPSAKELLADLNTIRADTPHSGTWERKSIVVLPFENISPDPEQEYFCDGMTEEIISDLSQVDALRVISRSSAMTFKGTKKKVREIADKVNVRYVLEGSVRKAGNNIRITAQLIDAANDDHMWSEKYSGALDDVFDIQEKVSRSIVAALKLRLTPEQDNRLAQRPIGNVRAYECYLRAMRDVYRSTADGIERALRDLKNGLKMVGDNALLYVGMGWTYFALYNSGITDDETNLQKMEDCANRAFELDPQSSHAHRLKGLVHYKRHDVPEAIKCFKLAHQLDPDDPDNLWLLSYMYGDVGRTGEAVPLVESLQHIDPLGPFTPWATGWLHHVEGRFESALIAYSKMYEMHPENPMSSLFYGQMLAVNGRREKARDVYDSFVKGNPKTGIEWTMFTLSGALHGEEIAIESEQIERLDRLTRIDEICSWMMSEAYALLGDERRALDWLENAVNLGLINYPFLSKIDPLLENLREVDGFKKLMERVKYEWENLKV